MLENLTAATALAIIAASVASAVAFSADRATLNEQRVYVNEQLRADWMKVEADAINGVSPVPSTRTEGDLPNATSNITMHRWINDVTSTQVGRYGVGMAGIWDRGGTRDTRIGGAVTLNRSSRVTINSRGTFGQNYNIPPDAPTIVDLAARGIQPGEQLRIIGFGLWGPWGANGNMVPGVVACFSASSTYDPNHLISNRLPDAVAVAESPGFVSGDLWNLQSYFPPASFQVRGNNAGTRSSVTVVVPPGATHLFLAPADVPYHTDNANHPDGFGVILEEVPVDQFGWFEFARGWTELGDQGQNSWSYGYYQGSDPNTVNHQNWKYLKRFISATAGTAAYTIDGLQYAEDQMPVSGAWAIVHSTFMHPNHGGGKANKDPLIVARRWTAPMDCNRARVILNVRRLSIASNGVQWCLVKNGTEILWSGEFIETDPVNKQENLDLHPIVIKAGDTLEFRLGARGDAGSDSTGVWMRVLGVI